MSEDRKTYDIQAFIRLVADRTGPAECPMCHTDSWVFEVPYEADPAKVAQPAPTYVLKTQTLYLDGLPAIPALTLTCQRCGFMRQHNLAWLESGLKDQNSE